MPRSRRLQDIPTAMRALAMSDAQRSRLHTQARLEEAWMRLTVIDPARVDDHRREVERRQQVFTDAAHLRRGDTRARINSGPLSIELDAVESVIHDVTRGAL